MSKSKSTARAKTEKVESLVSSHFFPERLRPALDEINRWTTTNKRFQFIKSLIEYFDIDSIVLIIRTVDKHKLTD